MMVHPETIVDVAQVALTKRLQVVQTENAAGRRQVHTHSTYAGDDIVGVATRVLEGFARTEAFGNLMTEPNGDIRAAMAAVNTTKSLMKLLENDGHMVHIGAPYHFGVQTGSESVS